MFRAPERPGEKQKKSRSARNFAPFLRLGRRDDSWVDMRKGGATFSSEKRKNANPHKNNSRSLVGQKTASLGMTT
jgi:hypothetical protein